MQYAHYRTQTVVHTKFKNFQRTDLRPCPSYTVTEHTVANGFRKHCFKVNIENHVSYGTTVNRVLLNGILCAVRMLQYTWCAYKVA